MAKKIETQVAEDNINTPAGATIKAHPTSAASKLAVMTAILNQAGGMPYEDLTKWYDQMMAVSGSYHGEGVPGSADKNRSTLDMKPSAATGKGPWKEEVEKEIADLFGGDELTEDFKSKAAMLFETALEARVILETAKIEDEYAQRLDSTIEDVTNELTEKVDEYLSYVAEQWVEDNQVAIDSSLRTDLTDEFITGLRRLFAEHYIDIPETKVDVVQELSNKIEEMEEQLNAVLEDNMNLKVDLKDYTKQRVFAQVSEGLVLTQTEKLKQLAEGIEYDGDEETFANKLNIVKEQYFKTPKKNKTHLTEQSDDDPTGSDVKKIADPIMRKYAAAISRTASKTL